MRKMIKESRTSRLNYIVQYDPIREDVVCQPCRKGGEYRLASDRDSTEFLYWLFVDGGLPALKSYATQRAMGFGMQYVAVLA